MREIIAWLTTSGVGQFEFPAQLPVEALSNQGGDWYTIEIMDEPPIGCDVANN